MLRDAAATALLAHRTRPGRGTPLALRSFGGAMNIGQRPHVALRPACDGDLDVLARLRVAALRENLERIGRFDEIQVMTELRDGFVAPSTRHILVGGERVGFVTVRRTPSGHLLDHLYLLPDRQRQGTGSTVLGRVIREAEAEAMPLWVGVLRGSDANRFYLRHGFRQVTEDACHVYYVRGPEHAVERGSAGSAVAPRRAAEDAPPRRACRARRAR